MAQPLKVPEGSIYFWMFTQGIKATPLDHVLAACQSAGKHVRQKDVDNYMNGYVRSNLKGKRSVLLFPKINHTKEYFTKKYEEYEMHPHLGLPEPRERFVPLSRNSKPLIKWSDGGMTFSKAKRKGKFVGENLLGCKHIVIDVDGDHESELDIETIEFFWSLGCLSHRLDKPKAIKEYPGYEDDMIHGDMPASFHLTFRVDRLIPTMHFPKAHVDILGNRNNTMRMYKNKKWNGRKPLDMTPTLWEEIKRYIRYREEE